VILLDEPTNGVDPVSRRDFWQILYRLLDEGIAILMSTSYLDEAERCHRVALLHQGRILFSGTPGQLKTHLHGAVLSLAAPAPRLVQSALRHAEGVLNLLLVGDGVHLVVDDAARRIPELRAMLQRAGLTVDRLEQISPTMEDVFVAATATREAS
jgi:ABC-2 type transport system ATP-binding protein